MNFKTLQNGISEGYCLIKSVDRKLNVKGVPYLDMILCDKSGEINAKLWDYNEYIHGKYSVGELIKIRGSITQYNGVDQLRVDKIRAVAETDNIDISELVPSAEYPGKFMLDEIYLYISKLQDEELKKLTHAIVKDNEEQLLYWPAAYKLHHAMRGGLLYHTLSILRMAESVCRIYPCADKDLLFSGAILHDICKIDEFDTSSAGIVTSYSVRGELLGHLVMGAMKISEKAKELGISEKTAMLLEHMVISHHGSPEYGAAVRPMFLEAEILSQLDTLDATIFEISSAVSAVGDNEFTQRQWALDNRKLFNHARKEIFPKANLE
ncbi:MAG: HD domain-containing protein [Faecalibacterium sp.]|nr:HD domain-containing protein [Ruminococcus sp.]MCM1391175.1 HD domain-containing protein [Ruminococcus sp.]MCM1486111.1 HD domain-containing protein [Faecalibacterium sp.]